MSKLCKKCKSNTISDESEEVTCRECYVGRYPDALKKVDTCVDNFDDIERLLKFESDKHFYMIQILSRKKDNKELGSH